MGAGLSKDATVVWQLKAKISGEASQDIALQLIENPAQGLSTIAQQSATGQGDPSVVQAADQEKAEDNWMHLTRCTIS